MPDLKSKIDKERLPRHIAIIMDGNGRWAINKGQDRIFGHYEGVNTVKKIAEACAELEIDCLTLYAFSTENWLRPISEVGALMELLVSTINAEMKTLNDNNISLHAVGDLEKLPLACQRELETGIESTSKNKGLKLILALSYSSRWDILNAAKNIAKDAANKKVDINNITENIFKTYLTTARYPDPELLIRTSGECRVSNFLLWEIAYSEFYFCDTLWPDFGKEDLYAAILDYQGRERRFGMTSGQIKIQ